MHVGLSSDLEYGIIYVHSKYPEAPLLGLGTSLGANLMLKYAGESGENCLLKGISAVSTPFNFNIVMRALGKFWPYAGIPEKIIMKNLKQNYIHTNTEIFATLAKTFDIDIDRAMKIENCIEFDELVTCKIHGFTDSDAYYSFASCETYMKHITIPTFALSSLDDPIVSPNCIPYEEFKANPNLILAVTRTGGHIGWYNGFLTPRRVTYI